MSIKSNSIDKLPVSKSGGISPLYKVVFSQTDNSRGGITIVGHLPEQFDMSIRSEFDTPFSNVSQRMQKLNVLAQAAGFKLYTQAMSAKVWQGSAPITMSIPFVFMVNSDTNVELLDPIKDLYRISMPTKDSFTTNHAKVASSKVGAESDLISGILRAPGPHIQFEFKAITESITDVFNGESTLSSAELLKGIRISNKISVHIGKFLYFNSVVIDEVSNSFVSKFTKDGRPLEATVTVTFTTFLTPTSDDINQIFRS